MRREGYTRFNATALVIQLLAAMQLCHAQPAPSPAPSPAGVEINIQAQPQQATVGDPIRIDLDITLPQGYQAALPKLGNQLGDFAILEFYPGPSVPPEGGTPSIPPATATPGDGAVIHHHARIVAAVYRPGEFEFPPLQITLRTPEGRFVTASSRPVKIQILSVLSDKEPQLKALKKQAEIQEPVRWILWLALALLLLIVAALAWWLYRRRRPSFQKPLQPQVDPLLLAEADLRDLIGRGLLEKGFVKQFYVLLSDIVKKILEAGYGIHTIEKTTSEIMQELRNGFANEGEAGNLQRIESVLCGCDLVKFAKYSPSKTEHEAATSDAFQILDSVKRLRSASSTQGQAAAAGVP